MSNEHTPTLEIVYCGSGKDCKPAIIVGDGVRIVVDLRERFLNPKPLSEKIIRSYNSHDALVKALDKLNTLISIPNLNLDNEVYKEAKKDAEQALKDAEG